MQVLDDLVDRLNQINLLFGAMSDEDQEQFENQTFNILDKLNYLVDDLDNQILNFNLSEEKCQTICAENKHHELVAKRLFPVYLLLNERLK